MSRVVGRAVLLGEVHDLLASGASVALHGPAGVGKSALLDVIEETERERGVVVVRCTGSPHETALPYAALRDLVAQCRSQCPADVLATLPAPVRAQVDAGLLPPGPLDDAARAVVAAGLHALLAAWVVRTPVLLLLDDVQWLDADTSQAVGYARRRLGGGLRVVATVGPGDHADRAGRADLDVAGLHHLEVPPLDAADLTDLLCGHGLAPDVAHRVHVESGGVPALALALAGAIGERPTVLGVRTPLPTSVRRMLAARVAEQPDDVRETLLHVALQHRPTVSRLERGGRVDAAADLRAAELAGLVRAEDPVVRLTPAALADVIVSAVPAPARAVRHRRLALTAATDAERVRHLALADPGPDPALAVELAAAADEALATGGREIAAELYVLAAERASLALADERTEWLVAAVEAAAPGNHVELAQRALAALGDPAAGATTRAQAVRVRLAVPELAGTGVAALDEALAAALADAGDDDDLVAQVLLQRARIALMESRPRAAVEAAERAVALLERRGEPEPLALGLTTLAVARRWVGGEHAACLARAVRLAGPTATGFWHTSPEYMAARFAFYDDRLDVAWDAFGSMLARVERGAGTDHVHVLRCLVEVGVRTGRVREALAHAERAERVGAEFDVEAYATWFITALAELAGGDVVRALTLARRGADAAEERGDSRYLQRHLILLGQGLLRSGDAQGAVDALDRVRRIEHDGGFGDPTVNRWHADLVSALVLLGRLDEADDVLDEARRAVARRDGVDGLDGVTAQLDRVEAELLMAHGDLEAADLVLERSRKVADDLGLRLDVGRALVTRAHLERRRRRVAAARAALREACALFESLHAAPWAAQVRAELAPSRPAVGDGPLLQRLTEGEARIAVAVAAGASNREIAERSYVSVKTVEATLTRIYRKLDLRSRTQLATLLAPARRVE